MKIYKSELPKELHKTTKPELKLGLGKVIHLKGRQAPENIPDSPLDLYSGNELYLMMLEGNVYD